MILGLFFFAAAVILAAVACRQRNLSRQEEQMMMRLRATRLYAHIYTFLERHDDMWLESLTLREDEIRIRMLFPFGQTDTYVFREHRLDNLTQETLYAAAQAAQLDMKVLRERGHYRFRTYTETLPNGEKQRWYEYAMRPGWREKVMRLAAEQ